MEDFVNILERAFGSGRPILLDEIRGAFPGMSEATLYRRLRNAVASSRLAKPRKGVYYIPIETRFGPSTLSDAKILEKKYLTDGCEVYGYVTGLALENQIGISNQVPGTLEIVTNRESTRSQQDRAVRRLPRDHPAPSQDPRERWQRRGAAAARHLDLRARQPSRPRRARTAQGVRLEGGQAKGGRMRETLSG